MTAREIIERRLGRKLAPTRDRPRGYDAWRLQGPDEDAPRGYRPKPCRGEMVERHEGAEYFETHWTECDTCGEIGETR